MSDKDVLERVEKLRTKIESVRASKIKFETLIEKAKLSIAELSVSLTVSGYDLEKDSVDMIKARLTKEIKEIEDECEIFGNEIEEATEKLR